MKEVVWLFDKNSKNIPRLTTIYQKQSSKIIFYFFYIITWSLAVYFFNNKSINNNSIIIGFLSGFIVLLLFDYLNDQNHYISIDNNKNYILTYNPSDFMVILQNKIFNLKKTQGVLLKKDALDKLIKDNKIKISSLTDYYNPIKNKSIDGNLWKSVNEPMDAGSDYNLLDVTTFNYMVVVFTLGIIVAGISKKILYSILPWLILSCIFSLCSQLVVIWNTTYHMVLNEFILKQKIFILGISFGIMSIFSLFWS